MREGGGLLCRVLIYPFSDVTGEAVATEAAEDPVLLVCRLCSHVMVNSDNLEAQAGGYVL